MTNLLRNTTAGLLDLVEPARADVPFAREELAARCLPEVARYVGARGAVEPDALSNLVVNEFLLRLDDLRFEYEGQVWAYLYQMSYSRLVDQHRRHRNEWAAPDIDDERSVEFEAELVDRFDVERLLDELTPKQADVLRYRFLHDLSISQTAERTGLSVAAVKTMQGRALRAAARAGMSVC